MLAISGGRAEHRMVVWSRFAHRLERLECIRSLVLDQHEAARFNPADSPRIVHSLQEVMRDSASVPPGAFGNKLLVTLNCKALRPALEKIRAILRG